MADREYDVIQLDTDSNPELALDVSRLQDKIGDVLGYYYQLRNKHGEPGGWELVEDRLIQAISWADSPLELLPEEE